MVVYYHEVMCYVGKLVHYLQCQGHSEGLKSKIWLFVLSSKLLFHLQPNLVWEYCIISESVLWKNSIQNVNEYLSGWWYLLHYDIFCTTEHFVTKHGVVMQHHKPECCVKNWIIAIKIKVTASVRMSVCVQMIYSKLTNILLPNLVLWCVIMSQSVMQKGYLLFTRSRSQQGFIWSWQFVLYFLNCWSFCYQTWFDSTLS